ncbi:tellurite resistance TerB family protein [Roseiconus lacunae]|uniref:TerB family tellurite resistance protein n=1 Tax=Roseiconus lacunae TaxID=2605694 RepID=UPI001E366486|nr:TerB family tellurite resistance protein [Roseiconus lacunae]MCD0459693.1 TerB family tellurite resistance protein [Roseiconus lacunae]
MSEKELSERVRQLRNLVVMAFADGSLGEREVDYVAKRCHELGLGESELSHAIRFGLGDDAALELPIAPDSREELLVDLIKVMAADGVLDENEKRLFALAAAKMEVSTERLNQLVDETLKTLDQ